MIQGLYSAATALDAATANQDLISENLAHVNVPGFRRNSMTFENVLAQAPSEDGTPSLRGSRAGSVYTQFQPGPLQATGNVLDVAITGDAFFMLDGPNGPVYTRNGSFELGPQGELQSKGGLPVHGEGGKITITEGGDIKITADGVITLNNQQVGRLQLAEFANPGELRPAGTTLFEGSAPGGRQGAGNVKVQQGYLEGSNVQVVDEMVAMMTGMRYYEAAERALHAIADAVSQNTRPQ